MEDRRNDEYEENKPKIDFKPFGGGGGNRLGADGTSAGPSTSATVTSPVNAPVAKTVSINVDQSQPTTKLRFRLCSGKQVVQGKFLLVWDRLFRVLYRQPIVNVRPF